MGIYKLTSIGST